jgi:predicted ester cyclase
MKDVRTLVEALVNRWVKEAVAAGRLEVFDELAAPPADLEGFRARTRALHAAFSDMVPAVVELLVEGDRAAWRWRLEATHRGTFLGQPATGRRVTLEGVNFQRLAGGRVIEHWTLADTAGLLQQLQRS